MSCTRCAGRGFLNPDGTAVDPLLSMDAVRGTGIICPVCRASDASRYIDEYEREQWRMAWQWLPAQERIPVIGRHVEIRGDTNLADFIAELDDFSHADRLDIPRITYAEAKK